MKRTIVQIVAQNARAAFEASRYESYRQLGKDAGVAANTVKNIMEPQTRAPNHRGDAAPRMDVVEKLAVALGYETWQLMQPDFQPKDPPTRVLTRREAEFYQRIRDAYNGLDKGDFDGNSEPD